MIYLCAACGWRINERIKNPDVIGKHLLYQHRAFCSEHCIQMDKQNPKLIKDEPIPSDQNERGWRTKEGEYTNWKIERKLKRAPRTKTRSS
jgi:hypothetical protein